jgi:hypothetical protein
VIVPERKRLDIWIVPDTRAPEARLNAKAPFELTPPEPASRVVPSAT